MQRAGKAGTQGLAIRSKDEALAALRNGPVAITEIRNPAGLGLVRRLTMGKNPPALFCAGYYALRGVSVVR